MPVNFKSIIKSIQINSIKDIHKIIQYFCMIPEAERYAILTYISNRLIEKKESIYIDKNNPIVKYLKSNVVRKDVPNGAYRPFIITSDNSIKSFNSINDYIDMNMNKDVLVDTYGNMMFDKLFCRKSESCNFTTVYDTTLFKKELSIYVERSNKTDTLYLLNNIIFNYCNKMVLSFMKDADLNVYGQYLVNSYLIDMNELIMNSNKNAKEILNILYNFSMCLSSTPIEFKGLLYLFNTKFNIEFLKDREKELYETLLSRISERFIVEEKDIVFRIDQINGVVYDELVKTLEDYKQNGFYRVLSMATTTSSEISRKKYIYQQSEVLYSENFSKHTKEIIKTIINHDIGTLTHYLVDKHQLNLRVELDKIYSLINSNIIKLCIYLSSVDLYIGYVKQTYYILGLKGDKIIMIPIVVGNSLMPLSKLIENPKETIHARVIRFNGSENTDNLFSVIESVSKIEFDEDSNLKLTFKRTDTNSYMNKYSEIHTLLVQNSKNQNYEAMKTDLARLYALLYIIERDVTHSVKPVSPSVKADGTKARMFIKNDLKRYLEEIHKYDKSFDLYKYFLDSEISKQIEKEYKVKINALGVKNLLKILL